MGCDQLYTTLGFGYTNTKLIELSLDRTVTIPNSVKHVCYTVWKNMPQIALSSDKF